MPHPDWFNQGGSVCCAEETFIHQTAYVDEPCQVGHGTNILHFSHIMANSVIGSHCQIGHNVTIASGVLIGDNVRVMNNASLNSGVILEDNVYCGASIVITPLKYIRGDAPDMSTVQPTLVKRGASIGANTTIAAGFTLGQLAFVESGTVIDRNIPDFAVVYGNPVRIAGWRCECDHILKFSAKDEVTCPKCGARYARHSECEVVQLAQGQKKRDSHLQPPTSIREFKGFD